MCYQWNARLSCKNKIRFILKVLGIVAIWGNISIYITSYLRASDSSVTMATTYVIFPITILMAAIFMQLGSYMNQRVNPKIQVSIGGLLMFLSLFSCSYVTNASLFIFLYAVVMGLSFGLLYMPGLKNSWQYFPSKKGLISGIVISSFSVGAIFWTLLTKAVANPNDELPLE